MAFENWSDPESIVALCTAIGAGVTAIGSALITLYKKWKDGKITGIDFFKEGLKFGIKEVEEIATKLQPKPVESLPEEIKSSKKTRKTKKPK